MKSAYNAIEARMYSEAMRLVPAVAAARMRECPADAFALYQGFIDDCAEVKIPAEGAWSMLTAAAMVWSTQLFERQAQLENTCVHEVIEAAVAAAQNWVDTCGG